MDVLGLLRQPKWGHLKDIHNAIKLCEEVLVATDPKTTSLGPYLEVQLHAHTTQSISFDLHIFALYITVPWKLMGSSIDPFFLFQATVYKPESGLCAAFLANLGNQSDATVKFNGNSYHLPAWSVSILPDCKTVAVNTAKVLPTILYAVFFLYKNIIIRL